VLPDIITPNQSAFVLGRLISDNILIAYELTHFLINKREGNLGYAAIKLDMSKAYDRVEWCFLREMMRKLGFAGKFDHEMCIYSEISSEGAWGFIRAICSLAGVATRGPSISLSFSFVC
jgi:hypothetical protein